MIKIFADLRLLARRTAPAVRVAGAIALMATAAAIGQQAVDDAQARVAELEKQALDLVENTDNLHEVVKAEVLAGGVDDAVRERAEQLGWSPLVDGSSIRRGTWDSAVTARAKELGWGPDRAEVDTAALKPPYGPGYDVYGPDRGE